MDNGRGQKIAKFDARELTEQINQATDLELAAGAEGQNFVAPGAAREQMQQVGWQVLDGGKNEVVNNVEQAAAEVIDFAAAQEIARDQAELVDPVEFVGDEMPLQTDLRLKAQRKNALNDEYPDRDSAARRVKRDQGRLARAAMSAAEAMMRQRHFSPYELERKHYTMTDEALLDEENPYYVGKGN